MDLNQGRVSSVELLSITMSLNGSCSVAYRDDMLFGVGQTLKVGMIIVVSVGCAVP